MARHSQPRTGIFTSGFCVAKMESFDVFRDLPMFRILEVRLEGPSNLTWVHSPSPSLGEGLCLWKGFDLRDLSNLRGANTLPERISWGSCRETRMTSETLLAKRHLGRGLLLCLWPI